MDAVAWLQFRQILGGKKLWLLAFFLLFPVGIAFLIAGTTQDLRVENAAAPEWAGALALFILYPQSTVVLVTLLHASGLLAVELEMKTLTYLTTRPLAKWRILCGKYAAVAATLFVPSVAGIAASWLVLGRPGGGLLLLAYWTAAGAAVLAYGAIFALLGIILPKRAMVLGLMYIVVESFISFVPAVVNSLTVSYYLRSIVARIVGLEVPPEFARVVGDASLPVCLLSIAIISALALAAASVVVSAREYAVTDQA